MNYCKSKKILGLRYKKFTYQREVKHKFVEVQQETHAGPHDDSYCLALPPHWSVFVLCL